MCDGIDRSRLWSYRKRPLWWENSSWLPWWQLNSYRGMPASLWSKTQSFCVVRKGQSMNASSELDCYDSNNKISKLWTFLNEKCSFLKLLFTLFYFNFIFSVGLFLVYFFQKCFCKKKVSIELYHATIQQLYH